MPDEHLWTDIGGGLLGNLRLNRLWQGAGRQVFLQNLTLSQFRLRGIESIIRFRLRGCGSGVFSRGQLVELLFLLVPRHEIVTEARYAKTGSRGL